MSIYHVLKYLSTFGSGDCTKSEPPSRARMRIILPWLEIGKRKHPFAMRGEGGCSAGAARFRISLANQHDPKRLVVFRST
jgi:hypothetical protein